MKLYHIAVRFLRLFNHLYFVEIRSSGRHHVPDRGPVILAANHPSSLLDSILLSTQVRRPIHYLARSGLFRFRLLAWLFTRVGAIPLYRRGDVVDHAGRNTAVFDQVYQLLERDACIGIFPEGRNSPWARVGRLHLGAARMALGAEARNDYRLGLNIVPVGINFENRELLMSAVLLRFGEPIRVADYAEQHREDPERAVRELTKDVQLALRRQAFHIRDRKLATLALDLWDIFGHELTAASAPGENATPPQRPLLKRWLWMLLSGFSRSTQASSHAFEKRMESRQYITAVLNRAAKQDPEAVAALHNRVERYKDHLQQNALRHDLAHDFERPFRERLIRLKMTLYAVVMAPVALFGLVHNALPYLVTKWSARRFKDEAVRAFAYFGCGVIAFTGMYAAFGFWLWQFTNVSLAGTLIYLALLPPTGFAAQSYRRSILSYRDRILLRTFFWNEAELVQLLRRGRQDILQRFQALAERHED